MYKCKKCGKIFLSENDNEVRRMDGRLFHEKCEIQLEEYFPEDTKQSISSKSSGTTINDSSQTDNSVTHDSIIGSNIGNTNTTTNVGGNSTTVGGNMTVNMYGTNVPTAENSRICKNCNKAVHFSLYDTDSCLCYNCFDKTKIAAARSVYNVNFYEDAIKELKETERKGVLPPEAMFWMGRCEMELKHDEEAIKWFAKSQIPWGTFYLGIIYQKKGNIERAMSYYKKASESNDEDVKKCAHNRIDSIIKTQKLDAELKAIKEENERQKKIAEQKAEQERKAKERERLLYEQRHKAEVRYREYFDRFHSFDSQFPLSPKTGCESYVYGYRTAENLSKLRDDIKKQIENPQPRDYIDKYKDLLEKIFQREAIMAEEERKKRERDKREKEEEEEEDFIDTASWGITYVFPFVLLMVIPASTIGLLFSFHKFSWSFSSFGDASWKAGILWSSLSILTFFFSAIREWDYDKFEEIIPEPFYNISRNICISMAFLSGKDKLIAWIGTILITTFISWEIGSFAIERIEDLNYMLFTAPYLYHVLHSLPFLFQGCLAAWLFYVFPFFFILHKPQKSTKLTKEMPKTMEEAIKKYAISMTIYFAILLCIFGIWFVIIYVLEHYILS